MITGREQQFESAAREYTLNTYTNVDICTMVRCYSSCDEHMVYVV